MNQSSAISELPNENKGQNSVVLNINEMKKTNPIPANQNSSSIPQLNMNNSSNVNVGNGNAPSMSLSQQDINEIVKGIQTASQHNLTKLPSRDIPMDTTRITTDNTVRPNYVPEPTNVDYIQQEDNLLSILESKQKMQKHNDRMNVLYDEVQTPLFVTLLFFFFQLPFFKKLLRKNLSSLFNKDGTDNFNSYILKSTLFGIMFYGVSKVTKYISEI
jgi:hypothetical protein